MTFAIIRFIIVLLNKTSLFLYKKRISHQSYKRGCPKAPEQQRPTLSLWIWRQKALLPEFSYFFLCEQMVFLFISCQILPITITVVYWETTMCWVLHKALKPLTFFFLIYEFLFKSRQKNEEKSGHKNVKESDSELCLYFAIYSKYFWNSCRHSNESSNVEWEMWERSFVKTLHFSSFIANRKGDCCAFY